MQSGSNEGGATRWSRASGRVRGHLQQSTPAPNATEPGPMSSDLTSIYQCLLKVRGEEESELTKAIVYGLKLMAGRKKPRHHLESPPVDS